MRRALSFATLCTLTLCSHAALSQDGADLPALVESNPRDDMIAPTSVEISPDGKFLYASAYQSATHVVFKRDEESGKLEHVQTIEDVENLQGATALRLSKDGDLAVTCSFRSHAVVLYARDEETGKLTKLDGKRQGADDVSGLDFAVELDFSPDGRFVYVCDASNGITVFRVAGRGEERTLEFVESQDSEDLQGARGIAFHPAGNFFFAACDTAGTLAVLKRDKMSGKTEIVQVLRDGEGEIEGLEGAFGVALADEGKLVYSVSGRFRGDNALGVYRFNEEEGKLTRVQEILAPPAAEAPEEGGEENPLPGFDGGNEITVSADGRLVCAVGSKSNALALLDRDAESGELTVRSVLSGKEELAIASGIAISADGKFAYVAAEGHNAVSVYRLGE